jgi:hypothetical protein
VGLPIFNGYVSLDLNPKLRGAGAAKIYREMILDEPAAGAFVGACNTLLRTDVQVTPGGSTDRDKQAAEFLEQCLQDMRDDLATSMRRCYSVIPFGWVVQELVYKRRGPNASKFPDGRVGWAGWGFRRQESLHKWGNDTNGTVTEFQQRPAPSYDVRVLPLNKCIHLVADDTEGSPEGRSALRGMYRQAYFVKNFELLFGIALERFGTGIPVFKQTESGTVTEAHLEMFDQIARALRQNEEAYIRVPFGYDFTFAPSPGLEAATYLDAITRFRTWALSTALAEFIALGTGDTGSFALGKSKIDLFLKALTGYQDRICAAIQRQAVARLFKYNDFGKLTDLPHVTLPAVREYDLQGLATFAEILERVGVFHPTPQDEEAMRRFSDLPDLPLKDIQALFDQDEQEAEAVKEQMQGDAQTGQDAEPTQEEETQRGEDAPGMEDDNAEDTPAND